MEYRELIIGGIGVISTITSSWISWFLSKKKYYSEVDHNLIENMKDSLEFYKNLSDDNRSRLEEMLERNDKLEKEIQELRSQMLNLTMNICMDLTCANRIREHQIFRKNGKGKGRLDETEDLDRGR